MREFSTQITQALLNGLEPQAIIGDASHFEDLYNLVPYDGALREFQEVVDVLDFSHRTDMYPFPQWFRFENDNIVVTENDIFSVDDRYIPFDLVDIQVPDRGLDVFTESFRAVDYGDNWILLNRDGCVYKFDEKVRTTAELNASAVAHHQNRTLIGGSLNGLWTEAWIEKIKSFTGKAGFPSEKFSLPLGSNFVLWSSYDSADFPFGLLHPETLLTESGEGSRFMEAIYGNEFGFMEMPFRGAVLEMIPSLGQVFVFGEDGIAAIAPAPEATGATYVETGRQPFGIKERGAVGGDEDSLVFIDHLDQLWYITNQGMRKLDFSDYLKELTGDIYIQKDPDEELFYIGDQGNSFVLRAGKLTRCYQTVTSISGAYPFRAGVVFETGDRKARFKTQKIDLGIASLKTLTGVSVATTSPVKGTAQASAEVKGRRVNGKKVPLNHEGYAASRIFGRNQQLEVELETFKGVGIERIELKWQTDDKRQTRGIFATKDVTGTGQ